MVLCRACWIDQINYARNHTTNLLHMWWCRMLDLIDLRELSNLSPSIDRRETRAKAVA